MLLRTFTELLKELKCSRAWLLNTIKSSTLSHYDIEGKVYYDKQDIEAKWEEEKFKESDPQMKNQAKATKLAATVYQKHTAIQEARALGISLKEYETLTDQGIL